MKAKYLLLILGIFYCMGIRAIEREITLYSSGNLQSEWIKDERSISLVPTATIDGSTIRIYTSVTVENIQIIVRDHANNIIYSETATLLRGQPYSFHVHGMANQQATLELNIGENVLTGIFSIE